MTAPFYKDNSGRSHFFPAEWKDFTDYEKEEWDKIFPSSLDRSVERIWDEEMNIWVERPNKTIQERLDRSGSQPGEEDLIEGYVNLMKSMLLCIPKGTHEDSKFLWQIEIDRLEELRSQPSQPGDGKEEVFKKLDKRLEALEHYLSSEAFGELANGASKAQSVVFLLKQDLHSLLKSKPTDGWSDEHEKEFDSWMWNNGYINNHRKLMLFGIREFKKWLSSYKQTKQ